MYTMGSPLDPTFANLEQQVFIYNNITKHINCSYDIFVAVNDDRYLQKLKEAMESSSALKFTYEVIVKIKFHSIMFMLRVMQIVL